MTNAKSTGSRAAQKTAAAGGEGHREPGMDHEEGAVHSAAEAAEGGEEESFREENTEDVLHAFRKGRADAALAAKRTIPAVKKSVSKGTYMFCYFLSFGAVYTAELAMSVVPEDSVIRDGFRDGAAAARELRARRHAPAQPEPTAA